MSNKAVSTLTADLPQRAIPTIDPTWCKINVAGNEFMQWFIRLPHGAIADDLKEPSIFKRLQQGTRGPLRKHDMLRLVAFDESWIADATVAEANATEAVLAGVKITQYPARIKSLFQDDKFKVEWAGQGYCVVRKSDGAKLSGPHGSEELAIRALSSQYATRV